MGSIARTKGSDWVGTKANRTLRLRRASGRVRRESDLGTVWRARSGDVDAFEELVRANAPSAYRLAVAIVGESQAPDVVQDAFVLAWRGLSGLRDPDRFVPWLFRIVANRARTVRRSDHRIREIALDGAVAGRVDAGRALGAAEARAIVEAAFRRLSPEHRTVIGLHYAVGLSIAETAAALDVPVGTAKSKLAAALAALRADVGRER